MTLLLPFLSLILIPQSDPSVELVPRWMPSKSVEESVRFADRAIRIVLKLRDDAGGRAVEGRLQPFATTPELSAVSAVLDAWPMVRLKPLMDSDPAFLAELRASGQARTGRQLADLSQYFSLLVPEGFPMTALVADLLALDVVENVYAQPMGADAGDIAPPTPDFQAQQTYRGPAPIGIDADYALSYVAGTGSGVRVVDLERQWVLTHEDLSAIDASNIIGTLPSCWVGNHGTAVLGEIIGDPDGVGVTGLAPDVDMKVAPVMSTCTGEDYNIANALLAAAEVLEPGDVILIEQQLPGPNAPVPALEVDSQFGYVPAEYFDDAFNTIQVLTANGIHVVEAAGNGSQDLDSVTPPLGDPSYPERFTLSVRDSGAILVAASTSGAIKTRKSWSNHGSCVSAFAWGENIYTTGYGAAEEDPACNAFPSAPDPDQYYTECFGGTSGAAPMVTAAVAILEALHRSTHGMTYGTTAMRGLVRSMGTTSVSTGMGRQPDLRAQLPTVASGALLNLRYLAPNLFENLFPRGFSDVNGDGHDEWLLGRFEQPPPGVEFSQAGHAMMMDGLTGEVLIDLQGDFVGEQFGAVVTEFPDTDQDGLDDILVGAPGGLGRVTLFSSATGEELWSIHGEVAGERFGQNVLTLGDLDGDGKSELAVSAPSAAGVQAQSGKVLVFSSADGSVLFEFKGQQSLERFGTCLAVLPDLDQKGLPDLAIGAPGAGAQFDGPGRVVVFSLDTGEQWSNLSGTSASSRFGATMVLGPDPSGNGSGTLWVGAPGQDQGQGAVYGHLLPSLGTIHIFAQPCCEEDEMGLGLSTTDDRDGDGHADLLVGTPGFDGVEPDAGAVYLVSTKTLQILETYWGIEKNERFGAVVAGGDLDGDGRGEVLSASDSSLIPAKVSIYLGGINAGVPQPQPPSIFAVTPSAVDAVAAGSQNKVFLSGSGFESAFRILVDGKQLAGTAWQLGSAGLEFDMPLVSKLGPVSIEVHTFGGVATSSLTVLANAAPTLDLDFVGPPPMLGVPGSPAPAAGLALTTGSSPGDFAFLLLSFSFSPTLLPGVLSLDIGAGLQDLSLLKTAGVPGKSWTQWKLSALPNPQQPIEAYFQAIVLEAPGYLFPATASNVQSVVLGS